MIVTGIPSTRIGDVWPALWPLIQPAAARSKEKGDILGGIRAKDLQAWAVWEYGIPRAGIVTRLRTETTSGHRDCRIWLVGGVRLKAWLPDFLAILIPWAKSEGCTSLSGSGRLGWARIAHALGCERVDDEDGEPAWRLAI